MKRLTLWTLCMVLQCIALIASANTPSYALHKSDRGERSGDRAEQSTLRVYDRKTGHTVWKRTFRWVYNVTWSSDYRALAFVTAPVIQSDRNRSDQYRIVVWRAGEKIRFYTQHYITDDGVEFFVWSPDNTHLLIGTSGSGMDDMGTADMFSLNLNTGFEYFVDGAATERVWHTSPIWHGNHQIVYRKLIQNPDKCGDYAFSPVLSKKLYRYCYR